MTTHAPFRGQTPVGKKVAVIGAGLAGIAAALKLLQHGHQVCLFEAAPQAGGRARGVIHANTTMLDNGQHLCIGAYRTTLALLQQANIEAEQVFMRLPLSLHMHHGAQRMSLVTPTWLPAPLHLLWGLLTAHGLDWRSKWRAICWMQQLKHQAFTLPADITVATLLAKGKQTPMAIRTLWEPLCLAALNTPITFASAQVFLNVLRDSFQHRRHDSDFLIVKADLSSALIHPLLQHIQTLGAEVRLHSTVTALQASDAACVISTATSNDTFEDVIVAVGPHQLKTIAGELSIPAFDYQPITTVYLQYSAETRLPHPIMGLCHGLAQWVFDRGRCCGQAGLLAVVISAHPPLNSDKAVLVTQCIAEINQALAAYHITLNTAPQWTQVITEKRATFSCTPDVLRPGTRTSNPHVFLAGDYIAGPYPATIEGTITSGYAAAQAIIDRL
ncbi:hydroxysqualene dehydroxylase HpnE [Methylophilus sp. 5]|uniref:hydroxysqualene dehydroxylase HpnE n=1 Tax=Methylophilus sp. 5 TaxID=1112274 RepID=UPI0004AE9A2F|nr:hydroxysqualene dehydroxylase HpnE [Methylophilus sp. 5]